MFHGTISLNSSCLLLLLFEICLQFEIDLCISHREYWLTLIHLSGFHLFFPAAIVRINHFFCLHQQNKSSESKVKSRRLLIVIKGFLKLSKFLVLIKKGLSLCRNLFHMTFGKLTIILSTLVNLLHLLCSTVLEMLPSASVQAKLFPKTVSDNSNIND